MASKLGSLIPPLLKAKSVGSSVARMSTVVEFYSKLPKGSLPAAKPGLNPFAQYKHRYFSGDNASGAPFVHLMVGIFLLGYTIDYQFHLKHHKNGHH